ncbi:hypothetical protein CEXT_677111 [Caerostris extrusa]|uniref:Transposase n=1 Tax=Caerostris extrusa TaxID=172846 RepID=A0AAV4NLD5_CAEEX|nr:hypothetical protein CEXT_677111 [Caerostris extrusa]
MQEYKIKELQNHFKKAADRETWISHGVELQLTKPVDVEEYQDVVKIEKKKSRDCNKRATNHNYYAPPKRHTAKLIVEDKAKNVRIENKFSKLKDS